ncbi:MAG: ATP-binding protein [Desulfopila sp.]
MKIKTNVICSFLFVALFAVSITGFLIYSNGKDNLNRQALSFLHTLNSQKAELFAQWLKNASTNLELLAGMPVLRERLPEILSTNDSWEQTSDDQVLNTLVAKHLRPVLAQQVFTELFLLSVPEGRLLASTDASQVGKIMGRRPFFIEGRKHTHVESVFFSMSLQRPTMVISTPIKSLAETVPAVLVGRLDLHKLSAIITQQRSHWDTEDTYLVNKQNFFITDPLYGDDYMLRRTIYTEGVNRALAGGRGTSRYLDYGGREVLGDYLVLDQYSLVQLTEIDYNEYVRPINKMKRRVLLVALLIVFVAAVLGWGVAELVLRPLTEYVKKIEKIDADNLEYHHEETTPYEINTVSRAFAELLARLEKTLVSRDRLRDEVTRRRVAEKELQQSMEQLEHSNRELEQFAYVASHDLQEPLIMVASFNQLLADRYGGRLDEKADTYIHYSIDGTRRMQKLIQDLLSFSRVTTAGRELVRVDTQEVLDEARANLLAVLLQSSAVVTSTEMPEVLGDRTQLVQLFQNLLSNGLKFCRKDVTPAIGISAVRDETQWRFSVADNGIGIPTGNEQKIFTIFKRLHTREEYDGTGIGLALARRIVERHNGEIWFESREQIGTTFHFTLQAVNEGLAQP